MSSSRSLPIISVDASLASGRGAGRPAIVTRWSRRVAADLVGMLDVLTVLGGAFVPMLLAPALGLPPLGTGTVLHAGLIAAIATHFLLHHTGMYDTGDMRRFPVRPGVLGMALAASLLIVLGLELPSGVRRGDPATWLCLWLAASFAALLALRLAARAFLASHAARGQFSATLAVFGAGRIADRLREHLSANPGGITLTGVYDDRTDPARWRGPMPEITGTLDDLIAAGREGRIDRIIIALPAAADQRIAQVVRKLEQLPVSLHVVTHLASDLIEAPRARWKVSSIGPIGLVDVKRTPLADWGPLLKAGLDYSVASLMLALVLPVFALVAIAIKLDSRGPVFFRQRRRGLNHRMIEVVKFRTMRVMENSGEVKQAQRNDPRVTRVGRFLRMTSLDELPQIINVLNGEMSLVGPRPHALVHDEQYGALLETYANRHQLKPGITGWAQINGFRGETPDPELMRKRVEHDLQYINNWSFALDLKILALTPFLGLMHKNAY